MHLKKAQIAYEFLLIFFVLTALFTVSLLIGNMTKIHLQEELSAMIIDDFGRGFQQEAYTIIQLPDGFTKNITLPSYLNNKPYQFIITNDGTITILTISNDDAIFTYDLPRFQLAQENQYFSPGDYILAKRAGTLILIQR